ncbi:MAG: hypothetical protein J7M08_05515 [Planctomycetes bacterium]|nr:hypothetical protein [Planctomycetota bacterium]
MSPPEWKKTTVISGRTARRLLDLDGGHIKISPDLGKTTGLATAHPAYVALPDGQEVSKDALADSFSDPEDCIEIRQGTPSKIYFYDEERRKYYKLFQSAAGRPPTIVINGATMHSIVDMDPWEGAERKVAAVPARGGQCWDTCCGLGYSAQLLAAGPFDHVLSTEVDPNVLAVAALNPWSEGLFSRANIELLHADLLEFVEDCPERRFACVFHDPPTIYQAGDLYSRRLYEALRRVLRPGGLLYHYVGAPGQRLGRDLAGGVMRRLHDAGFCETRRVHDGVLCARPREY